MTNIGRAQYKEFSLGGLGLFTLKIGDSSPILTLLVMLNIVKFYHFHQMHLGPLHTRAKSRDHEIVRAQKKVSKGRPNTPP